MEEKYSCILLSLKQIENEIVTLYKILEHYTNSLELIITEKEGED